MIEFRITADLRGSYVGMQHETFELPLSIGVLTAGDRISPVTAKNYELLIVSGPEETRRGWVYAAQCINNEPDSYFPEELCKKDTVFIRARQNGYSGSLDWGPARPFEESLTVYQALDLAIETLKNFEAEYSEVGAIIERLKKAQK